MVRQPDAKRGAVRRSPAPPSLQPAEAPLWTVPKEWIGDTVFIIAGGPSVRSQDLSLLSGKRVIAVNSSWQVWPSSDVLFFSDVRWWQEYGARAVEGYRGKIVTISYTAKHKRILKLQKQKPPPGLTKDPQKLVVRFTSLQGAINLAVHYGAAKIVLLGADMQKAADGAEHHHAPHRWPQNKGCWDQQMDDLIHTVPLLQEWGIDVINTSVDSRIAWWPKMTLEEFLVRE